MKTLLSGIILSLLIVACSEPTTESKSLKTNNDEPVKAKTGELGKPSFNEQMKVLSQEYFVLRPQVATYYGVKDDNAGSGTMSRLGDFSPKGELKRRAAIKGMLTRLEQIGQSDLTAEQRVSLNLVKTEMQGALTPAEVVDYGTMLGEYGVWFMPYAVSHLSGLHVEFPVTMEDKFAVTNSAEAEAFLSRLKAYPAAMDGLIEKMQHDVKLGVIPPDFIIDKTIKNLQAQIIEPASTHPMMLSYKNKLAAASLADADTLVNNAAELIQNGYYPATRKLIAALNEIRPQATHTAGIGRLPKGAALYQAMIGHLGDSTQTAEQIHQLGLSEVARITEEMDGLLKKVGYTKGTVGERMQVLLNDPKYIYPNTAEGKAQLMADIQRDLDLVNAKLKDYFGRVPTQPVAIKAVPESQAASTSGAFYDAPSQDGTRPGTFWISLYDTASLPSYSLQTLTYHETNPGHHLQTIIGLSDTLPLMNTIFYSNAAGEGWALYAERLAAEMGIYADDPIDDIGRLQSELHRAVRLVVDTGMHAKGWSREQAIEYSIATEGNHIDEATSEVERYVVWPGQALGYKLGELKIRELREKAKKVFGSQFDIRVFHDRLLEQGALPLNLMQEKIDSWLQASM